MTDEQWLQLWGGTSVICAALFAASGVWRSARASERGAKTAASKTVAASAENGWAALTARLTEERENDRRENIVKFERLGARITELEGRVETQANLAQGYRAFIGVQRDTLAAHGIALPPWPEHLPR